MNSPICAAPQCSRPPVNGYLCLTCFEILRRDLDSIPQLLADLEVTICRQDKLTEPSGRSTDERPLPLRIGPMEARRDLAATLDVWATHLQRGSIYLTDVAEVAAYAGNYIRSNLGRVQIDEKAGDLADEIGYAVIMAWRTVDKPLAHQFVGPCDLCGSDLYAHPRAEEVKCRNEPCDAVYDVQARRDWLLELSSDRLATATDISRALPGLLQQQLTAATIRGWARYGKITPHPPLPDRPRDPVYKIGQVIAVAREMALEEAAKAARKAS